MLPLNSATFSRAASRFIFSARFYLDALFAVEFVFPKKWLQRIVLIYVEIVQNLIDRTRFHTYNWFLLDSRFCNTNRSFHICYLSQMQKVLTNGLDKCRNYLIQFSWQMVWADVSGFSFPDWDCCWEWLISSLGFKLLLQFFRFFRYHWYKFSQEKLLKIPVCFHRGYPVISMDFPQDKVSKMRGLTHAGIMKNWVSVGE